MLCRSMWLIAIWIRSAACTVLCKAALLLGDAPQGMHRDLVQGAVKILTDPQYGPMSQSTQAFPLHTEQ